MEAVHLVLELTYSWNSQSAKQFWEPLDSSLKTSALGGSTSHPFLTPHKCDALLLVSSCLGIKNSEAEFLLVHPVSSLQSDSTLDFWSQTSLPKHCPRLTPELGSFPRFVSDRL